MPETGEKLLIAKKLIRHGKRTATIAPSSRGICEAMVADIDPATPQTIVELGAGTGPITEFVARRMHPESRLYAFEIDADLADACRRRCPAAEVINDSAAHFADRLRERGVGRVDVFLNGLPTPSLPRPVNVPIFEGYRAMACGGAGVPDAAFLQITVMPWVYKRMYERLFDEVEFTLVVKNVPPGGVYRCRGLREGYTRHLPGKRAKKP